ncbi:unnamed protein product [Meganyctiphanes norvegica]|uniref:Uncharacterized protein n=1 Tax=Meganyctiphanes norvegica TaxID=48144 RepID=A0AAV2R060_MEGNR
MPKAKDMMIGYSAELNCALMEITEISTSEIETGLVENVMKNPTKVLCLKQASSSEVENWEIPQILMLNVTPKAKTVKYFKENDHEKIAEHNEDLIMEEKLDKMIKYNVYQNEKNILIYKWRLLKTERKLFIVQLQVVEEKLKEMDDMDDEDIDTVELQYINKELEGNKLRKILRENLDKQGQIQEIWEELAKLINSLSLGESDEDNVTLQKKISGNKSEVMDQEKSPRTIKGPSFQEKYENIENEGFKKKCCSKKPLLKWQNHRKYRKIKSDYYVWKNLQDDLHKLELKTVVLTVLIKILLIKNFPFMKGKEINSATTTNESTYKDGHFKFKYTILVSLFCL